MAASIASYPQGYQSSAPPTQNFQLPPAATASTTEDPLLTALREYITKGSQASNITTNELHELYLNETSQPGGKANLEALLSTNQHHECRIWKESKSMTGTIELTLTKFSFTLRANEIGVPLNVAGSAKGLFFEPYSGSLTG